MLTEEGIKKRIKWLNDIQEDLRLKGIEYLANGEIYRISDVMDKISETRGKIIALELVLNEND